MLTLKSFKRTVALLALATVPASIIALASTAHASDCTNRLTVSVDGAHLQPAACGARTADAFAGTVSRRSYRFSDLTLAGQVLTGTGSPAAAAPISVVSAALDGSNPTVIATGHTNAQGWYGFRIPRGASRLLTIENLDGGSLTFRELVSPNISLRVHARPRAVLILWGRVLTDSTQNPTVVLQDLAPTGWQTFGVCQPSPWGSYRYVYHSDPSTVGDRYAIRATTMPTSAWQPGISGVHEATVR
jgi:hypothetical protein